MGAAMLATSAVAFARQPAVHNPVVKRETFEGMGTEAIRSNGLSPATAAWSCRRLTRSATACTTTW
jgi:hypothetical protein